MKKMYFSKPAVEFNITYDGNVCNILFCNHTNDPHLAAKAIHKTHEVI